MGRIYKKVQLQSKRDLKKATRSIIMSCKDLSRGRKIKRLLSKMNRENNPMIINTLAHDSVTLHSSLNTTEEKSVLKFVNSINNLVEEINYSFTHQKHGYFRTMPKSLIADILKKHSKVFKLLDSKSEISVNPNNDEWQKTYLSAIIVWGNRI